MCGQMEYTEFESSTKHIETCQDIVKKKAKIIIIGPGAIGCLLTSYLFLSGQDPILVDYDPGRVTHISKKGLWLERGGTNRVCIRPRMMTLEELPDDGYDFVVLCVKTYSLESLMPRLERIVGHGCALVTIQNGIGYWETIKGHFKDTPLVLCTTSQGATKSGVNRVFHAGEGPTFVGPYGAGDLREVEAAHHLVEILNEASIEAAYKEDIYPLLWRKLLVNCAINPITALTRLKNGEIVRDQGLLALQRKVIYEVLALSREVGVNLDLTRDEAEGLVLDVCKKTRDNTSSMLQDVLKGSQTEIDYINGAVVEMGKRYGVDVETNQILTSLVKALSKKHIDKTQSL